MLKSTVTRSYTSFKETYRRMFGSDVKMTYAEWVKLIIEHA